MEKNNQPLIFGIVVIGAVLIIALALIFTRDGDETTTETTNETNTTDNQEDTSTGENGEQPVMPEQPEGSENPEQPENPETDQLCTADDPCVAPPEDCPTGLIKIWPDDSPTPLCVRLPSNWDDLTSQEKTDLNPFDCNLETQIIYAEDGTCHDVPVVEATEEVSSEEEEAVSPEFETKAELEAYIENPDYTDAEKLHAQRIYCSYEFNESADKCLAWGSYRYRTGNPFDGIVETERDREEKNCEDEERTEEYGGRIFCGSEEAYERWQALLAEPEVQALHEEQAVADDRFYTIADETIARLSLNIRLKHGAVVTFAQADIRISFVK